MMTVSNILEETWDGLKPIEATNQLCNDVIRSVACLFCKKEIQSGSVWALPRFCETN